MERPEVKELHIMASGQLENGFKFYNADKMDEWLKAGLIEAFAEEAHKSQSSWMKYLFNKGESNDLGEVVLPAWAVARWERQKATPYANLTEEEKESDRVEARRYIARMEAK